MAETPFFLRSLVQVAAAVLQALTVQLVAQVAAAVSVELLAVQLHLLDKVTQEVLDLTTANLHFRFHQVIIQVVAVAVLERLAATEIQQITEELVD
jgi:hypothetical protein